MESMICSAVFRQKKGVVYRVVCKKWVVMVCFIKSPHHPRQTAITTSSKRKSAIVELKALLEGDEERLEQEMTKALAAASSERRPDRAGHYPRSLVTRVGKLELRVRRDREGRFSTELLERCQRSEQALVGTLAEMHIQSVSTRKVKRITEELCGHSVCASTISRINKRLDKSLTAFAER